MRAWSASIFLVGLTLGALGAAGLATAMARKHNAQSPTEVLVDKVAGIVRIVVEGREIARFDEAGLHIEGHVSYAGNISDVGYQDTKEPSDAP